MMAPPSESFAQKRPTPQNQARAPATEIEQDARLAFAFHGITEVNRLSVAALVAIGAEDIDLAHECLGALVAELRLTLRTWNALRSASGPREAA